MGVLTPAFRSSAREAEAVAPASPQATAGSGGPISLEDVARWFGGPRSMSGVSVGSDSAMRQATVGACVRLISQDVGKLPLHVFRRTGDRGRERATDQPLYGVLRYQANEWQTADEFREMMQGNIELRGNAYAKIVRYKDQIRELIPLHPDRMQVSQDNRWRISYRYDGRDMPAAEVLHVRGFSANGLVGMSTIAQHREDIGLAISTRDHGARLFGNGARPGGILEHPGVVGDQAQKRIKKSVEEATSGENQHRLLILEEGMKWNTVGLSNEDAQFLETRAFQRAEICGLFRVPPHMIGDLSRATFNNIEHQSLEYERDTLQGRLVRWENRLRAALLTKAEQAEYYIEFDTNALLRGDTKTRFDAYGVALDRGWMSRNEVRIRENLSPVEGLDEYLVQLNMGKAKNEDPAA